MAPLSIVRNVRFFLLFLSCVTLLVDGCNGKSEKTPSDSVAVQAAHPSVGPISEEIAADAILAPIAAAAISPRINAPIRAEYVQRGSHVRRGQLLMSLDASDLQGSALDSAGVVTSARANLTATTNTSVPEQLKKAQLDTAQLKAALDVAIRTAREREALYKQGALAGRDADQAYAAQVQAQSAYDAALQHEQLLQQTTRLTDVQAAQGLLTSAKGKLESAEAQVSFGRLRSPIDGVVTERPLFPGETAVAGSPVITVMDTSSLLAKLHLAQATAQKLSVGHSARIIVPGAEKPVDATVSFISPALDPGSTTVEVWLKLPNADGRFRVGTPVHALIQGATAQNALQVPSAAIVPAEDGSTDVVVLSADNTTRKQPVRIGIRTANAVQILSGITVENTVVTEGGYGLDNGTRVTVGKSSAVPEDKD